MGSNDTSQQKYIFAITSCVHEFFLTRLASLSVLQYRLIDLQTRSLRVYAYVTLRSFHVLNTWTNFPIIGTPTEDLTSSPQRGEALYRFEVSTLAIVKSLPRMPGNIIVLKALRVTLVVIEVLFNIR